MSIQSIINEGRLVILKALSRPWGRDQGRYNEQQLLIYSKQNLTSLLDEIERLQSEIKLDEEKNQRLADYVDCLQKANTKLRSRLDKYETRAKVDCVDDFTKEVVGMRDALKKFNHNKPKYKPAVTHTRRNSVGYAELKLAGTVYSEFDAIEKFAAYEETGFTPEEINVVMSLAEKMNVCDLVRNTADAHNSLRHAEADISILRAELTAIKERDKWKPIKEFKKVTCDILGLDPEYGQDLYHYQEGMYQPWLSRLTHFKLIALEPPKREE